MYFSPGFEQWVLYRISTLLESKISAVLENRINIELKAESSLLSIIE